MNFFVRVWGPRAAFIGPKRDEPMTYPVMTPSAGRGILEAILWKPAIRWVVERIHVLAPLGRYCGYVINEVKDAGTLGGDPILVDQERDQRYILCLRNINYVIEARYELTEKCDPSEKDVKFREMFSRRLEKGQCHQTPYAGRRDFTCFFEETTPGQFQVHPSLRDREIDLGRLMLDFDYRMKPYRAVFFPAILKNGVLVEKGQERIPDINEYVKYKDTA